MWRSTYFFQSLVRWLPWNSTINRNSLCEILGSSFLLLLFFFWSTLCSVTRSKKHKEIDFDFSLIFYLAVYIDNAQAIVYIMLLGDVEANHLINLLQILRITNFYILLQKQFASFFSGIFS